MRSEGPIRVRALAGLILIVVAAPTLGQSRPTDPAAAIAELRDLFSEEQYPQVIRGTNRLLGVKSTSANDRHALLELKAEAHLRLGDSAPAAKAFDEAAEAAPDEREAAMDRAMAILVRRSKKNVFRPSNSPDGSAVQSYSILEDDQRSAALRALYADERFASARGLAGTRDAVTVADLLKGLDVAIAVRNLELAANGSDAESQAEIKPLADRAEDILNDQLKVIDKRVEKLSKSANTKKKMGSHYRKRGLAEEEKRDLRKDAVECNQIADGAERFAAAISSASEDFEGIRRNAQQLVKRAEEVLTADYSAIYDRN